VCAWDDPDARDELVSRLVNDALVLLTAVDGVEPGDQEGTWQIERGVAKHRIISTVDPESRHLHKSRSSYRDGYKAHVAVEPDTGIICGCELTPANEGDGPTGMALVADEPAGTEILADSAYGSGESLAAIDAAGHVAVIKPWPLHRNPNLGADQFGRDEFTIDYQARTVTCPNGSPPTSPQHSGRNAGAARSGDAAPQPPPARPSR
jgi:hypothetical protein